MDPAPISSIHVYFGGLPDPRVERTRRHDLLEVLAVALCAVICGADSWVQVELFGRSKEAFFRSFLSLPHGIPSHAPGGTFGRIFAALDPQAFERCFAAWAAHLCEDLAGEVVPIDGKTLRRSFDRAAAKGPLHLVSAWAAQSGLALGQVATEGKSNEITAIPRLLEVLELRGATVTIDAMGCQTAIARQVLDREGDYVLAVKGNQPTLRAEAERLIEEARTSRGAGDVDYHETVEKGHGRIEVRRVWCTPRVNWLRGQDPWPGLAAVAMVEAQRTIGSETTTERRYYISSLAGATARRLAQVIRWHWGIENRLHWVLDLAFDEDGCRVRQGHADRNLALLRKIALNLLRRESSVKAGTQSKRLKAGWDDQYLLKVLTARV